MANEYDYSTDDILNMLTVAMHVDRADKDSNWVKYFSIWKDTFQDIQYKTNTMHLANDLDNCYGAMLDDEARNVGINRNGVDDDFLRFEIKARLLARVCDGTMPMLYQLISTSLGCSPTEFDIQPMYDIDGTSNAIQINDIPEKYLNDTRKSEMLRTIIQDAVAYGIRVLSINYQAYVNAQIYVANTIQIEHEYTVGNRQRDTAYPINAQIYATNINQIEHEYTVGNRQRDTAYPINAQIYATNINQIEHEYNVGNKKRS